MIQSIECPACGAQIDLDISAEMDSGDIVFSIENDPQCSECGTRPEVDISVNVNVTGGYQNE